MQKVLATAFCCAIVVLGGCSRSAPREEREIVYRSSVLEELPFVYKLTVQQGNVVTQEMVDQLQPGMSKRQVRFVLGTPQITDVFHEDRWDYVELQTRGRETLEKRTLTLHFEQDRLTRIEGDLKPEPSSGEPKYRGEEVVEVPDYKSDEGVMSKALRKVGLEPAEE